jgi:prophage maintenance system killer protein
MVNGLLIHAHQGDIVALVVNTAEGQADVPTIAARLKAWAQAFEFTE